MPGFDLASPPHHPDRNTVCILHLAHYEAGIQAADAVQFAQDPEDELLVGLHARDIDLHQKVVVAGNIVALSYFIYLLDGIHYLAGILVSMLLHLDIAEGYEGAAQLFFIQNCGNLPDIALRAHPADTFKYRCRRKAHPLGNLSCRKSGILLHNLEDGHIGGIQLIHTVLVFRIKTAPERANIL